MTTHYSQSDYNHLKSKAESEGRAFDLFLCSDGVMRTKEDRDAFEKQALAALYSPPQEKI